MVVQSLDAIIGSVRPNALLYSACLITTQKRKSCKEMSRQLSVSHDKLNRALNLEDGTIEAIYAQLLTTTKS